MEETHLLLAVLAAVLVNIVVILTVGFMVVVNLSPPPTPSRDRQTDVDRQKPRPAQVLLLRQTSGPHPSSHHRRHQRPS